MKDFGKGFASLGVIIAALLVVAASIFVIFSKKDSETPEGIKDKTELERQVNMNQPPLKIKHLGIDLDYFDSEINRAGDIEFMDGSIAFNRIFIEYGFRVPAEMSSSGESKVLHQPTFIAPMGTKVRSLVDGEVAEVKKVWSGDYTIMVQKVGSKEKRWLYETEHVLNPTVKVGDVVTAGQIIAEVSDFAAHNYQGYGAYEIGILEGREDGPVHHCPFLYLDESVNEELWAKIMALVKSWEEFRGDTEIYDEDSFVVPGCKTMDSLPG